eukprot:1142956-Prorocentrum_minimum.AAC.4
MGSTGSGNWSNSRRVELEAERQKMGLVLVELVKQIRRSGKTNRVLNSVRGCMCRSALNGLAFSHAVFSYFQWRCLPGCRLLKQCAN